MERWYLAGRMTGVHEYNYPAFNRWAIKLRTDGYEIINPAQIVGCIEGLSHPECMQVLAPLLVHRETVGLFVLPEPDPHAWTFSKGGCWEVHTAIMLGKTVLRADTREPVIERYSYQGPMFTPTRNIAGLSQSSTETLGAYATVEGDLPAGVEMKSCDASRQRRVG